METLEALKKLTRDDVLSLATGNAPGIGGNQEEAMVELKKIADEIPLLWELLPATNHAAHTGDITSILYLKTVVNMVILIYKIDRQGKIDSILSK